MFSQGAGLSQLSCEMSGEVGMETSRLQNGGGEEPPDISSEKNCPNMATFDSRLKTLEKKRINFLSKIKKEDDEKESLLDSHERQKKQSLDLQMEIEELSENYQKELSERKPFSDRSKYYFEIVDIFKEHCQKAKEAEEEINNDSKTIQSAFENSLSREMAIRKKEDAIKLSISMKLEKEKDTLKEYKQEIIDTRECSVNIIKSCAVENDDAANKIDIALKKLTDREKDEGELFNTYNDLEPKIKSDFGLVVELQKQSNELMTFRSTNIQNLKVHLNMEKSTNANLERNYVDMEESLNTPTEKQKELINLTCQLKVAVEDLIKSKDANLKQQEEFNNQKCILKNKCISLDKHLNELKDVKNLSESIEIDINDWEKHIELNNSGILQVDQILIIQRNYIQNKNKLLSEIMSEKSDHEALCAHLQGIEHTLNLNFDDIKIQNETESKDKLILNNIAEEEKTVLFNKNQQQDEHIKKIEDLITELKKCMNSTKSSIRKLDDETVQNLRNLQSRRSEFNEEIELLLNIISRKKCEDDTFLITISDAIPIQNELPVLISTEESLIQEITDENLSYEQERSKVEQVFNAKISAIEKEMELHASVIDSIIKAEEEATNKMKVEIKATEDEKITLEKEVSYYKSKLATLKSYEEQKRMKIVKTDKRFRAITKEVAVTREDITDAINGKSQATKRFQSENKLMTPTTKQRGFMPDFSQPPVKKMAYAKEPIHNSQAQKQVANKRWVESHPLDEYDFSEWNQ